MNHENIHTEAIAVVARYKRCEIELIEILEKVWIHRTFQHYDCGSLFEYAVKHLKLSESVTNIYNKSTSSNLPTLNLPRISVNVVEGHQLMFVMASPRTRHKNF